MFEESKTIVRELLDGAWNRHDMSVVDKFIAPSHEEHGPFTDQFPHGPEGQKAFISTFLTAFPDTRCTIESQEAEVDRIKTTMTFTGTQTGQLMDIPPTGKQVRVKVVSTDRIVGGKIVETWAEWDPQDMLHQLGVERAAN